MTIRLWTYNRPLQNAGNKYEVKYSFSLKTNTSQLFYDGKLLDECTHLFESDFKVIEHTFKSATQTDGQTKEIKVSVGYFSWFNVGIEVREGSDLIYESHPGKDVYFAANKLEKLGLLYNSPEEKEKAKLQSEKWKKNKPSILADIGIGIAFFAVAKVTGALTTAAFTGVFLGLSLVVIQRFVKVDLLGGFAVFGTFMLLISAMFSLAFQSEYLVQLKGTFMGVLSASALIIDGLFNKGTYFGSRFENYVNTPIQHKYFVLVLALIGVCMAALNYSIATQLSEDQCLTYDNVVDTTISLIMFFILLWLAGKKANLHQS